MQTAIRNMPPWLVLLVFMLFSNQMIDASERLPHPLAILSPSSSLSSMLP